MKLKDGFMLRKLGREYTAVAMGKARKEFNGLIRMNETGCFLWNCLKVECSESELMEKLRNEYEVSEAEAGKDVRAFLAQLREAGILE